MTCREQVEAMGAKITVEGKRVTVLVPSINLMAAIFGITVHPNGLLKPAAVPS